MTPEALANMGYHIFPLDPNSRKPLLQWRDQSTTYLPAIQHWTERWPGCGWGLDCGKSGLLVLDDDRGKNPEAIQSLEILEARFGGIPETFTVRTRSGGYHYYFVGIGRNTASTKLGKGLDSRGVGGYVVAPCTPGYTVESDAPVAPAPTWFVQCLNAQPAPTVAVPEDITLDTDEKIRQAVAYLDRAAPAIEGDGGDMHTFTVACCVRDYGVSESQCLSLMLQDWNNRCDPPWDYEGLAFKVSNAYRYAANPAGVRSPEAVFAPYVDPNPPPAPRATFVDLNILRKRKIKIDYLVHGLLETPSTGLIFGDPSAGKSFLAIDLAMSVACGTSWMGGFSKPGVAVYFAGEGRHGLLRRAEAWIAYHGITFPDQRMFISERRVEFTEQALTEAVGELKAIQAMAGAPVNLIIVDTLARHIPCSADENSAKDVGNFINTVDSLRDLFDCTVAVVHHSGKMGKDTSRGSSAIRGAMDWECRVDNKKGSRSIAFTKQKESELPMPMGFTLQTVEIGEGISSAVPVRCEFDKARGDIEALGTDASAAMYALQFIGGSCSEKEWRTAYYNTLDDDMADATKRQKFGRARKKLLDAGMITITGDTVTEKLEEKE